MDKGVADATGHFVDASIRLAVALVLVYLLGASAWAADWPAFVSYVFAASAWRVAAALEFMARK